MSDQHQPTAPRLYIAITSTPAEDAACEEARALFARVALSLRELAEQVRGIVDSLEPHQPPEPLQEVQCEGRLPQTPALSMTGTALCLISDGLEASIAMAEDGARTTAETCAADFEQRQIEGMQCEHRQMARKRRGED